MVKTKESEFFEEILSTDSKDLPELKRKMMLYYNTLTDKSGNIMTENQGIMKDIEELIKSSENTIDID